MAYVVIETHVVVGAAVRGCQITKPFCSRNQVESFTDQTGSFLVVKVPIIWIGSMAPLRMIPLYGTVPTQEWHKVQSNDPHEVGFAKKSKLCQDDVSLNRTTFQMIFRQLSTQQN